MNTLRKKADSWTLILIFGGIYLVSQPAINYLLRGVTLPAVLRLQISLSARVIAETLAQWRSSGLLAGYLSHYIFDFLHPVWYVLFLTTALAKLFNSLDISARFSFLLSFPFIAGLCDLLENIAHLLFIHYPNTIIPLTAAISGSASILKWGLSGFSLLAIGVLLLRVLTAKKVAV